MKLKQFLAMLIQRISLTLGVFLLLAYFALQSIPASAAGMAFVRVVHASPHAGPVDVFVDGVKLLSNFTFGTVTGYVSTPAGPHKIQLVPAGKGIGTAIITQTVSTDAGLPYTVAALGTTSTGFSLQTFTDNNLLSSGMAKVRAYHLSPDAGPVNLVVGGNKIINGLTYQHASDYLTVPAGSYTFNVTVTQTGATVPVSLMLNAGTVNSVFAVGLLKGSPSIKLVTASVMGVPGMPGTGSDPHALPNIALSSWLPGAIALLLIGIGVAIRFFAVGRQK